MSGTKTFPAGKKKQIHVHQQRLRAGEPALIVRIGGTSRTEYFEWVSVSGPSTVIQPATPLACGAKAWMETESEVVAGTGPQPLP
jgi:hypothetical protein